MNFKNPDHILTIDDEIINNFISKSIITKYYPKTRINSCTSGAEAVTYLEHLVSDQQPFPEYIFLDLNMKMMSGWEFLDAYYDHGYHNKETRVVILTSSVFRKDMDIAASYGVVKQFVSKPLTKEHLDEIFSDAKDTDLQV